MLKVLAVEGVQTFGIQDLRLVVDAPSPDLLSRLSEHLGWPIAAIIIALLLRRHVIPITDAISKLHKLVNEWDKIAPMLNDLPQISTKISALTAESKLVAAELKTVGEQVAENAEAVSTVVDANFKEGFSQSTKSLEGQIDRAGPAVEISGMLGVDEMWSNIKSGWEQTKDALRRRMELLGAQGNFHGTSNIAKIVDELTKPGYANSISQSDADLIMSLARQHSWMYRTTVSRNEFLSPQVYADFMRGVKAVRAALG
jgi:uncharacterized protein YoxC